MKVYLASLLESVYAGDFVEDTYSLLSFYYYAPSISRYVKSCKELMIDSGAFTFMNRYKNGGGDFDSFVSKYIDFINEFNIDKYMELDVDQVKGLDYVEKVRYRLERETHRKSIPVWHVPRGIQYFKDLCENYDYIAIGGIGPTDVDEIHQKDFPKLKKLVDYAHKKGTKVHGLGFTSMKYIPQIHFDSVDSSSWTSAVRFQCIHWFNPKTGLIETLPKPANKRFVNYKDAGLRNLKEWIKFQKYAERSY